MFKDGNIWQWAFNVVPWVVATMLLASRFFKDVFGIEAFGKKIYKGAPMIWKWFMRSEIFRKDMNDKIDLLLEEQKRIRAQVEFNGGSSIKDAVERIEIMQKSNRFLLEYNQARMEINDRCSKQMAFRMDKEGACIMINDAFLKRFGYVESDILGFSFENTVHEDDVNEMRSKWQRSIDKRDNFYDEQRIYHRDGTVIECIVRAWPISEGGNLKEFYGTIDIINQ